MDNGEQTVGVGGVGGEKYFLPANVIIIDSDTAATDWKLCGGCGAHKNGRDTVAHLNLQVT
jgi:hypothetical protein